MQVLILAGGLGTRLRAVVSDRPKPMADVGDRPFLAYLIDQVRDQGFDDLVLCTGYMADQVRDYFGNGSRWQVSIRHSVETERLGTAGAVKHAQSLIDGTCLVMNGDSYVDADLLGLVAAHREARTADPSTIGTLLTVHMTQAAAYGTLDLDEQGCVREFREKASSASGWINAGVYVLEPQFLDQIPAGCAVSIERETFPSLLDGGWRLFSQPTQGFFVDIGTPEGYRRFQQYMEEQRA